MSPSNPSTATASAKAQMDAYEGQLTYAERQLGAKGRAKVNIRRYLAHHLPANLFVGLLAVSLLFEGTDPQRYFGGALALWVVYWLVKLGRNYRAMKQAILEMEEDREEPEASPDSEGETHDSAERRFKIQAERILQSHTGELYYADHQLRKAGEYEVLANNIYTRRQKYLLVSLPIIFMLGISLWSLLIILFSAGGFVKARRSHLAMKELVCKREAESGDELVA